MIGEGEFGEVWAGLLKGVGDHSGLVAKVAVKKLKDESLHKGFLAEVRSHVLYVCLSLRVLTRPGFD
jgi:hypothetical protein